MTQTKWNHIQRIIILLLLAAILLSPVKAEAEDAPINTDQQPALDMRQPSDAAPTIKTTVTVRSYSINFENTSTDDKAAEGYILEMYYSIQEEVDRINAEKEAINDETFDAAWDEAHELARELVKNGKYKEVEGYDNMYINKTLRDSIPFGDIYDFDIDTDDPDEFGPFEPDPKTPHTSGAYYEGLNKKYPHVVEFYFFDDKELKELSEPKGTFQFYVYVDYSSIDQSKVNYTELANTFKVSDHIEISGLEPDREYFPTVRILQLNDDGSTSELASTDKVLDSEWYSEGENTSFKTNSNGDADLLAVFDNLEIDNKGKDECKYVVTVDIKQSPDDLEPVLSHNDLTDTRESFNVFYELDTFDKYRTHKGDELSPYGWVKLPGDDSDKNNSPSDKSTVKGKSPDTGDDSLYEDLLFSILFLLSAIAFTAIINNRKHRSER